MVNTRHEYVPEYATITAPFHELTKKNSRFAWNHTHQKALEQPKEKLTQAPVMTYFDTRKRSMMIVDASPVGISAILAQREHNSQQYKILSYVNRPSTSVRRRCSQTRNTQRAVLQNSCSTVGILLGNLILFNVLLARWNASVGRLFFKTFCEMGIIARKRENIGQSSKIWWNYGCSWWNAHNSLMLCNWLGKILVPLSWEWRTPFNLPGKAVMRWQASFLSPVKFQGYCRMFLKFFVACSRQTDREALSLVLGI